LSAEAQLPAQRESDAARRDEVASGLVHLKAERDGCARCHRFHDAGTRNLDRAPDMTGYGTREWLVGMIDNPGHSRFYGSENDEMPAFGGERLLTPEEIETLADWLRQEWVPTRLAVQTRRLVEDSVANAASPGRGQPQPPHDGPAR
jgi:ubiquinol-cytochrome c reductase cytochrome b subunit